MPRYRAGVTGSAQRPLLFLDVDGPLIPFGASARPYPDDHPDSQAGYELKTSSNPLLARIDHKHGPRLMALRCDLVWATAWMNDANECISPRIGLPQLPVVIWPEPSDTDDQDERDGVHWKTRTLVAWAAGRSFVWVDDEITTLDQAWVSAHYQGHALLHRVDPTRGLTAADYETLAEWLNRITGTPSSHDAA